MNRPPVLPIFALALAALSTSCGGDDSTDVVDIVVSVSVSPATATLGSLSATTQLTASAAGSGGSGSVPGTTFTWSSSNADVVTVDGNGLATAIANGSATITATAVGTSVSGTATITVAQVAATVTVTPEVGMLQSGETLQLTATATDAGGSPLASPNLAWSSSDDALATVDATGLVLGVSSGAVVITAAQDGASDTSALDVIRADLMPTGDVTLGGTVEVGEVMIPAGVTVTLSDDLTLDAEGPVVIAGNMIGDCLGLSLTGQDAVTISGMITNACSTLPDLESEPPTLDIVGNGIVNLSGATITSSGDVTISNVPAASSTAAGHSRASATSAFMDPEVQTAGLTLLHDPPVAQSGDDVSESSRADAGERGQGRHGASHTFRVGGKLSLDGTTVIAQEGGPGGNATGQVALGGKGGEGGSINISSPDAANPIDLMVSASIGQSVLIAGKGGQGGTATATAAPDPSGPKAPTVNAFAGSGGRGGIIGGGFGLSEAQAALLSATTGDGGKGGNGTATAPDGVPADAGRVAQIGGAALAISGGGDNPGLLLTGVSGKVGEPGPGGTAVAVAGKGGDGVDLPERRDGAAGGDGIARGTRGGESLAGARGVDGPASASGGNGGSGGNACGVPNQLTFVGLISLVLDPAFSNGFFLNVPPGGTAISVGATLVEIGGPGGGGGSLSAATNESDGTALYQIGPGGNGGDGGSVNGEPGPKGETIGSSATQNEPIFKDGMPGGSCPGATAALSAAIGPLLAGSADRIITITSATPWISVTGTLSADGTVTANGRGVVNFNSGILAEFAGTFDEVAGTLSGSYTIDSERIITPNHPIVYQIDVATSAQASSERR